MQLGALTHLEINTMRPFFVESFQRFAALGAAEDIIPAASPPPPPSPSPGLPRPGSAAASAAAPPNSPPQRPIRRFAAPLPPPPAATPPSRVTSLRPTTPRSSLPLPLFTNFYHPSHTPASPPSQPLNPSAPPPPSAASSGESSNLLAGGVLARTPPSIPSENGGSDAQAIPRAPSSPLPAKRRADEPSIFAGGGTVELAKLTRPRTEPQIGDTSSSPPPQIVPPSPLNRGADEILHPTPLRRFAPKQ